MRRRPEGNSANRAARRARRTGAGGGARPSSRGEVFQARDFQKEEKATRSPLSSARTFPGPLCTTTYIDRESVPARRGRGERERESEEESRGGEEGGRERVYGRVRYTGARTKKETSALSPPLSHMVATLPFPRRDATMSVSVSLSFFLSLSLSLCLSHSLALPLPPILV